MRIKHTLITIALLLHVLLVNSQNYVHTLSQMAYEDLTNAQVFHGTDSIASGYYVNINLLFPAFGAMADFNSVPSIPSFGAYVARNGYVAAYENPLYTHTFAFHGYLNNLIKINTTSTISANIITNGPYKTLKFQWKNMGIRNHSDTEYVNFQIWFDEANQSVSYHYGPSSLFQGLNAAGAIGLLRAPNNFSAFTNATYLKGDAADPDQLEAFHPTSFNNMINANNFPTAGTLITFKRPTTGIKQHLMNKSHYSITSNPFNESIALHCLGTFNWQILDVLGRQIKSGTGIDEITISTADLTHGMHLIKIERQNEVAFEKLFKE